MPESAREHWKHCSKEWACYEHTVTNRQMSRRECIWSFEIIWWNDLTQTAEEHFLKEAVTELRSDVWIEQTRLRTGTYDSCKTLHLEIIASVWTSCLRGHSIFEELKVEWRVSLRVLKDEVRVVSRGHTIQVHVNQNRF